MDKRNSQRVSFETTVVVNYKGRTIEGNVKDLSMKGLYIVTDDPVELNDQVNLYITLSGSTSKMSIGADATISRVDDSGFAIAFKKMELDSYIILKNIVFYADDELHDYIEFL